MNRGSSFSRSAARPLMPRYRARAISAARPVRSSIVLMPSRALVTVTLGTTWSSGSFGPGRVFAVMGSPSSRCRKSQRMLLGIRGERNLLLWVVVSDNDLEKKMQTFAASDWLTRSIVWSGGHKDTMDLVHFGRNLRSHTLDKSANIARGEAEVRARRLSAALWNCNPSAVSVATQATCFGRTTAGFLTVSHAVAWPVMSKVAKATYHVLRPVSAVGSMGEWIMVRFLGGEVVRYAHNDDSIWACMTHVLGDMKVEHRTNGAAIDQMNIESVLPYDNRHPHPMPLAKIEALCTDHDLYNCWLCANRGDHLPVPPPPPPPFEEFSSVHTLN